MKPLIQTCTSLDCPERKSICCGAGRVPTKWDSGSTYMFACKRCGQDFVGGKCNADKPLTDEILEEFDKRFEIWKAKEGKYPLENFPENYVNLAVDVKSFIAKALTRQQKKFEEELKWEKEQTLIHAHKLCEEEKEKILEEIDKMDLTKYAEGVYYKTTTVGRAFKLEKEKVKQIINELK